MSRTKVKTTIDSRGIRHRFDREVKDATDPLYLKINSKDIAEARQHRLEYEVNDPENYVACLLAQCLGRQMDAQVAVFRRVAYVAHADEPFALRYEIAPETTELIHANDEGRFDAIAPGTTIKLRVPCVSKRLVSQRARMAKVARDRSKPQSERRKVRNVEPATATVVWRDGKFATDAAV